MIKSTKQQERTRYRTEPNSNRISKEVGAANRISGFYEEQQRRVRMTQQPNRPQQGDVDVDSQELNIKRQLRGLNQKTATKQKGASITASEERINVANKSEIRRAPRTVAKTGVIPRVRKVAQPGIRQSTVTRHGEPDPGIARQKNRPQLLRRVTPSSATVPTTRRKRSKSLDWSCPPMMLYFSLLMGVGNVSIHGLDLLIAWPFHQASVMYDVVFLICGAILAGMSWHTYKAREKYR